MATSGTPLPISIAWRVGAWFSKRPGRRLPGRSPPTRVCSQDAGRPSWASWATSLSMRPIRLWPSSSAVTATRPWASSATHTFATPGTGWRGFAHYEDYYEQNVLVSPSEALRCTALGRWLIRLVGTSYNVRADSSNSAKDAARINRDFLRWLSGHPGHPFFAFLNYIDVHDPYQNPPEFSQHFGRTPETPEDAQVIREWNVKSRSPVLGARCQSRPRRLRRLRLLPR